MRFILFLACLNLAVDFARDAIARKPFLGAAKLYWLWLIYCAALFAVGINVLVYGAQ